MGSGSSIALSHDDVPKQLFVEGAGSTRVNGKYVLRTDKDKFPRSVNFTGCNHRLWFSKDGGDDCWILLLDVRKRRKDEEQRKWIICTAKEMLYMVPITDEKCTPPQGRWELAVGGTVPTPTVNLQPLPAAFVLSGWKGHHDRLNGEYLPCDDATRLYNQRPIFQHLPVVGLLSHQDKWRMYWSNGAWRVGDEDHLKSDQLECIAFAESDAIHPNAMSAEVVWKVTKSGCDWRKDQNDFKVMDSVSLATGTVRAKCYKQHVRTC